MLVLSRKTNESIVINENVKVVVLAVKENKVRLGFEAPIDVPINRMEINGGVNQDRLSRLNPHDASSCLKDRSA